MVRPLLTESSCAVRQVEALGFTPEDVTDIVLTHLELDHAGGITDFPQARIHVHEREVRELRAKVGELVLELDARKKLDALTGKPEKAF